MNERTKTVLLVILLLLSIGLALYVNGTYGRLTGIS
ncbi:MAG: hypothetical protein JWM37_698 [Candidatus Saccharibacteria bacterium]|nr:hypothetical protein [Candidatus Saccharibacteria bacterium]